jgi:hypothetical protein
MTTPPPDPTLARRARIAKVTELAQRIGYGMFAIAIVVFFYGLITGFVPAVATVVIIAIGLGTVTLAPAIVMGYAVRAADREDRERAAVRRSRQHP